MVIFSHRGIGFAKAENSLEAFTQSVKEGFSVEADLRFKNNEIILAHDESSATYDPAEFRGFLNLISDNPDRLFALHIKENSKFLFERIADAVVGLRNCFLFVTDFEQGPFICEMYDRLGKERLGLYVTNKAVPADLINKAEYLWLDETEEDIYTNLEELRCFNKKIICCSPELFYKTDIHRNLERFRKITMNNNLFGICTDFAKDYRTQEESECPICKSKGIFSRIEETNGYVMLRCGSCFLEFAQTMNETLPYYENLYYNATPALKYIEKLTHEQYLKKGKQLFKNKNWQPYNTVLRWLSDNLKPGDVVLDLGCSTGWFMAALEAGGFRAVGMDVSDRIINLLKMKGFTVFRGPLENCPQAFCNPDSITMFEVLEHLHDPVSVLKEIYSRFSDIPFIISVPADSSWTVELGIRSYCDYPPNHLTRWSELSLKKALNTAGYKSVDLIYPKISASEIYGGILIWLTFKLGLRKRGYFGELENASHLPAKMNLLNRSIRFLYPILNLINNVSGFFFFPLAKIIAFILNKRKLTSFSLIVIAH